MQIALLVLKIILIALLVILCVLLGLLLLVLLVPIRYRADVNAGDDIRAQVKVSWLSFVLRFRAYYAEKTFRYYLRIFFFLIATNDDTMKRSGKKERGTSGRRRLFSKKEGQQTASGVTGATGEDELDALLDSWEKEDAEKLDVENAESKFHAVLSKVVRVLEIIFTAPALIVKGLHFAVSKLFGVKSSMTDKLNSISDKLKPLNEKRKQVTRLLELESTKRAIRKAKKELFSILRHICPRKVRGTARIGMEDPETTGKIFGVLGIFLPLYYPNVHITPDFHEAVMQGELHLKGHIRLGYLAVVAIRVFMDKYIKKTIARVKRITS